ncbi:MAG: serine/threonine-protein kinase [Planctomycetota bacterium]
MDSPDENPESAPSRPGGRAPAPADEFSEAGMTAEDATVLGAPPSASDESFPTGLQGEQLAAVLTGELLGHFHLLDYIGGGGMGVVFRAQDTTLNRIVAVKVVASRQVSLEDLQKRFLVEAQSSARLDHPNIARVHYVGRDRGLPYIVFEYVDGRNLRDLVREHGPVPIAEAIRFTFQIADALAHASQRDVIHRDIKPANIVVADGQAKLVDMGLARFAELGQSDDLTTTGVTLGTFDYISPEQARDPRSADTRSDIYSLGCTLYFMLAGRPPFVEGTAAQKLLSHQESEATNIKLLRSDVPQALQAVLSRMLAKQPMARQQDPVELLKELQEAAGALGIGLAPKTTFEHRSPAAANPWLQRNLYWLLPAAALLLGAAGLAAYDASQQSPPSSLQTIAPDANKAVPTNSRTP